MSHAFPVITRIPPAKRRYHWRHCPNCQRRRTVNEDGTCRTCLRFVPPPARGPKVGSEVGATAKLIRHRSMPGKKGELAAAIEGVRKEIALALHRRPGLTVAELADVLMYPEATIEEAMQP